MEPELRVFLLNQFLAPDSAPTGQLLADLGAGLAAQGHDVTVICARGGYDNRDGTGSGDRPHQQSADRRLNGVRVLRTPALPFSHSRLARLGSWLSYYVAAIGPGLRSRPDLVLTMTTPPLLSLVGTLLQRFRRARHVIWEMDLYPDVCAALGVFRLRSLPDRAVGALADFARRRADAIVALGPCMRERLLARGIPPAKIFVAENWAGSDIRPLPFPAGPLTLLYSGNLGLAHDVATIGSAIQRLGGHPRLKFVFAGGGPRRASLESLAGRLPNLSFLPYEDAPSMSRHLGACHVGLVTQNPDTLGCVVPSKTYSLMAAGRPVLFIGPRRATPALVIHRYRCGWQIDPGDVESLVSLLQLLAAEPALVRGAGRRARAAFESHYTREAGVARVAEILDSIIRVHPCSFAATK